MPSDQEMHGGHAGCGVPTPGWENAVRSIPESRIGTGMEGSGS